MNDHRVHDLEAMREQVRSRRSEEPEAPAKEKASGSERDFILRCAEWGELGDGMLFAEHHRDKLVFNHQSGEWMIWRGSHWDIDLTKQAEIAVEDIADIYMGTCDPLYSEKIRAEREGQKEKVAQLERQIAMLKKKAGKLRTVRGTTSCLAKAQANRAPLSIRGDEIDCKPMLLAVANGVLDLRSGELHGGRPGDYLVKASPVVWQGIDAPCEQWERALLEIMNGDEEMVAYLRRLFGYAITGLTTEHIFVVLHGKGRNGKSIIVETVKKVLGSLAGPIPSEMLLDQPQSRSSSGPSPDIMELRGHRLAFASETDEGRKFSASRVKWFSGGDSLTGRYPHDKRLVSFEATHQLFLLTNHKPHAPADDFAFWERMHLIPFDVSFVDRPPAGANERPMDKQLGDKLKEELPGILAWLVRGCLEWQRDGLNPPAKVTEATSAYRKDEDVMIEFFEHCCLTDGISPEETIRASALYDVFQNWWERHISQKKVPKQKVFGKLMREKGYPSEKKSGNMIYRGIRLSPEALGN